MIVETDLSSAWKRRTRRRRSGDGNVASRRVSDSCDDDGQLRRSRWVGKQMHCQKIVRKFSCWNILSHTLTCRYKVLSRNLKMWLKTCHF